MMDPVKLEIDLESRHLCSGCLSQDRQTRPIPFGELRDIFDYLVSFQNSTRLCWECMARLRHIAKFRHQVLEANSALVTYGHLVDNTYSPNIYLKSLSRLSISKQEVFTECPIKEQLSKEKISIKLEQTNENKKHVLTNTQNTTDNEQNTTVNEQNTTLNEQNTIGIDTLKHENDFDNIDFDSDIEFNTPLKEISEIKTEQIRSRKNIIKNIMKKKYEKFKNYYLEHAVVTNLDTKWTHADVQEKFTNEYLNEEQIEEHVIKFELSKLKMFMSSVKCKECPRYLPSHYITMHRNLQHHKPGTPNTCQHCRKTLSTFEELKQHWQYKHSLYSKCHLCGLYCKGQAKLKHLRNYHTQVFKCVKCPAELQTSYLFNAHYKAMHATFICDVCNKKHLSKATLIKHIAASHGLVRFKCEICKKTFKRRQYLNQHNMLFHTDHSKVKQDETTYCVECDRNFLTRSRFQSHLTYSVKHVKPKVKSIPCPECGKIFRRLEYMKNHLRQVHHPDEAKHFCDMCGKHYINSYSLRVHYSHVHLKLPKPKNIVCDICGRAFHTRRIMLNHKRTHTGERPFACDYCSARFSQKYSLTVHARTHFRDAKHAAGAFE